MKLKNRYFKIIISLIIIIGAGILFNRVTAQDDRNGDNAIKYLEERFKEQNIPVLTIKVLQENPLQLEFVIQSESDGEKGTPEDPINYHMVVREATLAKQQGYIITYITEIFLNKKGDQISKSEDSVNPDVSVFLEFSPAKIDDVSVKEMMLNKKNALEVSEEDLSVSSINGLQTLNVTKIVPTLEEANQIGLETVGNLRPLVADVNNQGAQIVMVHVEIKNEKGDFFFNYLLDLQMTSESWWMAEGFDDSWFPHP